MIKARFSKHTLILCVVLALLAPGCSSKQKAAEGDAAFSEEANAADAGTDAVPPPPSDDATASADPAAPEARADEATNDVPPPADDLTAVPPPAETAQAEVPIPTDLEQPVAPVAPIAHDTVAGSGETQQYTVQEGDTLMKIAFETYGDLYEWRKIYDSNRERIQDPNRVPPGTVLTLDKPSVAVAVERNGDKYLIKRGDTLGTIANEIYGAPTHWRKLWNNNRQLIKNPNRIFAGFYLYYTTDGVQKINPAPLVENEAPPAKQPTAAADPQALQPAPLVDTRTPASQQAAAAPPAPAAK